MAKRLPVQDVPIRLVSSLEILVPVIGRSAHAGFPSPADDFIEEVIDLNKQLIGNQAATFLWRVVGDCMVDAKIFHGDVIIVDRSLAPKHRSIVLAIIDGEPTVKRVNRRAGVLFLLNDNRTLPPFLVSEGIEVSIWGVVTWTLRDLVK